MRCTNRVWERGRTGSAGIGVGVGVRGRCGGGAEALGRAEFGGGPGAAELPQFVADAVEDLDGLAAAGRHVEVVRGKGGAADGHRRRVGAGVDADGGAAR